MIAPNAKLRPEIIPSRRATVKDTSDESDDASLHASTARMSWARLCETFDVCETQRADLNVALVIGVSEYTYLEKLETTKNDARELADFLLKSGEFDQVIILTEKDATRNAIVYFMDTYIPQLLRGKRSRFLFYFSGHGELNPYSGRGFLRLITNRPDDYAGAIGMDVVNTWANENTKSAVHSLFLIDACMSGIVGQEKMRSNDLDDEIGVDVSQLIDQQAGILITAGTHTQEAIAHSRWHGSLFNNAVMKGLQGNADRLPKDGVITARELYSFVRAFVMSKSGNLQTPKHWVLREDGSGDFFFVNPRVKKVGRNRIQVLDDVETLGGKDAFEIETIDSQYKAVKAARVRRGPGTRYQRIKTLELGEPVWVLGKVKEKEWYQLELEEGIGYTFAPLLRPGPAASGHLVDNTTTHRPLAPPVQVLRSGEVFHDKLASGGKGPEMLVIPAGRFQMGSNQGASDEKPVHEVEIGRFAIGRYEVTNADYVAFLNAKGNGGSDEEPWFDDKAVDDDSRIIKNGGRYEVESGFERHPVIELSWYGAQAYVNWLSEQTGKAYRLPSEAEWEYVARAGSSTKYPWGDQIGDNKANCAGCGSRWDSKGTAPVGSFKANQFGLFDTVGNVWEWVEDCWNGSYEAAPKDGTPWTSGNCESRVLRGGSWGGGPGWARSAYRYGVVRHYRGDDVGFRVAQDL